MNLIRIPLFSQRINRIAIILSIALSELILNVTSEAQAFEFSVLGAATSSNYAFSPAVTSTAAAPGFGLGLTLGVDLFPFFALEMGGLFIDHSISATILGTTASISYNYIQIPALVQFTPVPFIVISGGVYYGIGLSATSSGAASLALVSSTGNGYLPANDFGLMVGAGLRFPLLPLMKLRLDALYEYGLNNISSGTSTQNSRNLDIWAGIQFGHL